MLKTPIEKVVQLDGVLQTISFVRPDGALNPDKQMFLYPDSMDPEIIPLCNALNRIKGVQTTFSCAGHYPEAFSGDRNRETYISVVFEDIAKMGCVIDAFQYATIKWNISIPPRHKKLLNADQISLRFGHTFDNAKSRDKEVGRLIHELDNFSNVVKSNEDGFAYIER